MVSLRSINSELSIGGEHRFKEVAASSSCVVILACVGGKLISSAVSGIWDLLCDLLLVAWPQLISTLVRSTVIHGCAIFQVDSVTVIRLEVENRLAVNDFYCILNNRRTRTILTN